MITYVKGDIFNSPAQVITNTVNTEGFMGKGIALEYKKRFPKMYEAYKKKCISGELTVGNLMLYKEDRRWILLFPTKKEWRRKAQIEYIEAGLSKLADNWDRLGIHSIAMPKLGCGNGGLEWNDVKSMIKKYLGRIPIDVYVYTDEYEDKSAKKEDISDLEKWQRGELNLKGYDLFKKKLINELTKKGKIILSDGHYCVIDHDKNIVIDGNVVYDSDMIWTWNYVRNAKVVTQEEAKNIDKDMFCQILELMFIINYVSRIYVSKDDDTFTREPNAYQYIVA